MDAPSPVTGATLVERLASNDPSPEEEASTTERDDRAREALDLAMSVLTEREQTIVRERWTQDDPVTLEKLGVRLGVSKERVRQIEERARAKLRARLEAMGYEGAAA
jgi:RNA polymerase sigma-32 factor